MSYAAQVMVGAVAFALLIGGVWLLDRHRPAPVETDVVERHPSSSRTEECERCGAEISIVVAHLVVEIATDDDALGNRWGGTVMSAAYCSNHCPGGCLKECASEGRDSLT